MKLNFDNTKYLGKVTAERDGVKGILETWERFTPLTEHNEKIEATITKLQEQKVDSKIAVGVEISA